MIRFLKSFAMTMLFVWLAVPCSSQEALNSNALQGTWRLKSLSFEGVPQTAIGYMIFQGSHYIFITTRDRKKFTAGIGAKEPERLTEEEKLLYVEAFRNMTTAAGSFTIQSNEIAYLMEVVRTPNLVGQTEKRKSWFQDGSLVQDFIGGGQRQVYIWERVSDTPDMKTR